jgi:hypothetical protein
LCSLNVEWVEKTNENKNKIITYGVKTMNQQRIESEPAIFERKILTGVSVPFTNEVAVEAPWLASQKKIVWATIVCK